MTQKKKTAFTLIELAIVIVIIAIVISMVVGRSYLIGVANLVNLRSISASSPIYEISDNTLWLDVSNKNAFTPYPSDRTIVGSWTDSSPYLETNIAFTTALGDGPEFIFDSVDGLPALYFDGGDRIDSASVEAFNLSGPDRSTIFVVVKKYTQSVNADTFRRTNFKFELDASSLKIENNGIAVGNYPANFLDKWNIIVGRNSDGVGDIRVNGINITMTDTDMTGVMTGSSVMDVGKDLTGNIREIIIFKRALDNDEIVDIESYLSNKWQIDID